MKLYRQLEADDIIQDGDLFPYSGGLHSAESSIGEHPRVTVLRPIQPSLLDGVPMEKQVEVIRKACGAYMCLGHKCALMVSETCIYGVCSVVDGVCPYLDSLKKPPEPMVWERDVVAPKVELKDAWDGFVPVGIHAIFAGKKVRVTVTEIKEESC